MGEEISLEERCDSEKVRKPSDSIQCSSVMLIAPHSVELLRANDPSHMVARISPTPLLMTVAENDVLTPTDIALETFQRAREPKQLHIIPGGHFDGYSGPNFESNAGRQAAFLRETLGA
jgi:fermentation-respiration switch protein FrsA (DUF1100 family)